MVATGLSVVLAAVIAGAVFFATRRFCSAASAERYAGPAAFAAGFGVAYVLQVPWAHLAPSRAWHWSPYLALAAAAVAAAAASGPWLRRWLLEALVCCLAALLLVPDWKDLWPARGASVPLVAVYFFAMARLMEPLAVRVPVVPFLAALAIGAGAVAVLIALFITVTLGGLVAGAAAALAGCCLAAFGRRGTPVHGLGLPVAVVVGGWSYTAGIDPQPMLPGLLSGLLIAAAAPLALWWRIARGPKSVEPATARQAATAFAIDVVALGMILGAAAGLMSYAIESTGNAPNGPTSIVEDGLG